MASIPLNFPPPSPVALPLAVGAVTAVAAPAFVSAEAGAFPLPGAQSLAVPAAAAGEVAADGAAMRPDQVMMSRQLAFQRGDAGELGASWRSMVRSYGQQLQTHEQQALARHMPPAALLLAGQDGRGAAPNPHLAPADPWRFTVHAGGPQAHHLSVIGNGRDEPPGRRRRARAALLLELELADGTRVAVQVEPVPGGVALELYAPGAAVLARLRALQPALEQAVARAGLQVRRWTYREHLPARPAHATIASGQAEAVLTLQVFNAVAELALLLPAD